MTALAIVVVVLIPAAVILGLLQLANVVERRRATRIARQIALTDAIHAVLGPVVAPRVRRLRRGRFMAELAVPRAMPEMATLLEIARASLGPDAEIVLTSAEPAPAPQRRTPAPRALRLSGARFTR
jgi:hypothetical protein